MTGIFSGKWSIDADAKQLVLDAARFDVVAVEGKLTKQAAIDKFNNLQKVRTMTIYFLGARSLLCEDNSFRYDYRRVPSN